MLMNGLDRKTLIFMPHDRETADDLFQTLAVPYTPADLVLSPDGAVTFLGAGNDSLRAAWRWIKYHDRLNENLGVLDSRR